jgi:hypothetical protein
VTRLSRLFYRFFGSLPGLMLVAVAWDALLVATLSLLSGPLRPLGIAQALHLDLSEASRVGRIIPLYHSLAMPLIAALVYLVLDQVPLGTPEQAPALRGAKGQGRRRAIAVPVTLGYLLASLGGMTFGYGGHSWIAHAVYLLGLALVFYAGLLLAVALWPWRRPLGSPDSSLAPSDPCRPCVSAAPTRSVPTSERLAFFLVALYTLISAAIGASAGAFFGNGFTAFLAEDIVRVDPKTVLQLAVIAHLHIMLTLIDVMILLLIIRTYRIRGRVHRVALPLTLVGTTIVTLACWSVILWEGAHVAINAGSAFLLPGAILVAIWGFAWLMRGQGGQAPAGLGPRLRALLRDPLRFGLFFELILVNLVVTVPGVYVAIHLETYRLPAWLEVERTVLVGHWHILATLSAVMVVFLVADRLGVHGWLRQVLGWGMLAGSTLAFVFVNVYMFRRPGEQRAWTTPFFETGIALSLLALALFVAVMLAGRVRREDSFPSPS